MTSASICTRRRPMRTRTSDWSYAFVRHVREGDVVLHYRTRPTGAITHWSRAVGSAYADEVVWGRTGGRAVEVQSIRIRVRGWRRPLEGPYALLDPVSTDQLREIEQKTG
jgi:hypothetical protein